MRVLLVNNTAEFPVLFKDTFSSDNDVTVISWDNLYDIITSDFDFVVLSGSSNFPIAGNEDKLRRELDLVRSSKVPILGICYGFELIVVAFGGTLKMMSHKEQGVLDMDIRKQDPIFKGIENLFVYEGHKWTADVLPSSFIQLAKSTHGIEAVRHKERFIYGFQFHPEKLQRETVGGRIIQNFISLVQKQVDFKENIC